MWIVSDPHWHIDAVGRRLHHQSPFVGNMNEDVPMKKTRFTEAQIMGALHQIEGSVPAADLCREHCMSSAAMCGPVAGFCRSFDHVWCRKGEYG